MSKKKSVKQQEEKVLKEEEVIDIDQTTETVDQKKIPLTFNDNSFAYCVNNITDIPEDIFGDITLHVDAPGTDSWYSPYNKILKHHGYDMIFYAYKEPLPVTDEILIEHYQFNNLPTGKCIILGRDGEAKLRCVVGLMDEHHRIKVIYDPIPTSDFTEIFNIGFFIKTFIKTPKIVILETGDEIEVENE